MGGEIEAGCAVLEVASRSANAALIATSIGRWQKLRERLCASVPRPIRPCRELANIM